MKEGKGRRRAIRARHREARYNALRGSLHFLLPGTPLRTLTNEAAEQAAGPNGRPRKLDDNGCSRILVGQGGRRDGGRRASKTIR